MKALRFIPRTVLVSYKDKKNNNPKNTNYLFRNNCEAFKIQLSLVTLSYHHKQKKEDFMLLHIIRHADPDYKNGTITEKGHKEALALSSIIGGLQPTHLYSSPLGRAKDTAAYTVKVLGLPLGIEDWTQEIDGFTVEQEEPFGRSAIWDYHPEKIRELSTQGLTEEDWLKTQPYANTGYEKVLDTLVKHSDVFLAKHGMMRENQVYRIDESFDQVRSQRIIVFCHGGFGLSWLSHLLRIPFPLVYSSFYLWPSSVTTLLFEERKQGIATPRCIGLADITHLKLAGLNPQPRGLLANDH